MTGTLSRLGALSPSDRARVLAELARRGRQRGTGTATPAAGQPDPVPDSSSTSAPSKSAPRRGSRPTGTSRASGGQEQQWFLAELTADHAAYIVPFSFRLRGMLDQAALQHAVRDLTRRHEVLRSSFRLEDDGVHQQVADIDAVVPIVSLTHLPPLERDRETERRTAELMARPFDLTRPPLVRSEILELAEDDHVLLWVAHHAVADGWSVGVVIDELIRGYAAATNGQRAPLLPEPALQYADVAEWQRDRAALQQDDLDRWAEKLRDTSPASLPTRLPRPDKQTFAGDTVFFTVPTDVTAAATAASRRHGTTMYATLLAALGGVLVRHGGAANAIIGGAFSGRSHHLLEPVIGPLATTVPLQVDASGDPTFGELVERTRDVVLDGFAAQELPFGSLVAKLGHNRDAGRNPLYDVLFSMGSLPLGSGPVDFAPGVSLQPVGCPNNTARLDLEMTMEQSPDGLSGRLDFNTALYTRDTALELTQRFLALLAAGCREEHTALSRLPLQSTDDITSAWRQAVAPLAVDWSAPTTFVERFRARVAARPDATAVECGSSARCYAELDAVSDLVAERLRSRGAGPGSAVAVGVGRDDLLVPTVLGVLKSGAAYVPLDADFPAERTRFVLRDSGARLLVDAGDFADFADEVEVVVSQEEICAGTTDAPRATPAAAPEPATAAYVMYTSGSTGRPKGVVISHRALCSYVDAMAELEVMTSGDRTLALARMPFDGSISELVMPLALGATIVVVDRTVARDGDRLVRTLADRAITVFHGTPAHWRLLLAAGWDGGTVHTLLSGAEAISSALAQELTRRVATVWNMYGPTECTVWSLAHRLAGPGAPPIGRPVRGVAAVALDPAGTPVPPGVPGELHLAGDALATEYRGLPDLTAERFVDGEHGRWYRTGDIVRSDSQGRWCYLGRSDGQVKIRGHRVDVGEVEHALAALPGVREAVVTTREVSDGDVRLVAHTTITTPDVLRQARQRLAAALPDYMLPWRIDVLDAFPLTPGGKIDRRALAAMPVAEVPAAAEQIPTRPAATPTEIELVRIWAELLAVPSVGVHDDFFERGGHSLLALQLIRRVTAAFDVTPALEELFRGATVEAFAVRVDVARARRDPGLLPEVVAGLSPDQVAELLRELDGDR